jgi:hypothetical protein
MAKEIKFIADGKSKLCTDYKHSGGKTHYTYDRGQNNYTHVTDGKTKCIRDRWQNKVHTLQMAKQSAYMIDGKTKYTRDIWQNKLYT